MTELKAVAIQITLAIMGILILAHEVITSNPDEGIYVYIALIASLVVFGVSP